MKGVGYMSIKIEDIEKNHDNSLNLQLLMEAINDWRTAPTTLDEYFHSVAEFLKIDLSSKKENIRNALQERNNINCAWEIESITSLLELMEEGQTLNDLYLKICGLLKKRC